MPSAVFEPRVLLDGLAYVESPRWHEGDCGSAVAAPARSSRSTSTATVKSWAPVRPRSTPRSQAIVSAGRSTGFPKELLRIASDGSMVPHADLARLADFWNEIVVDARGNVYVNSIAFQFIAGAKPNSGASRSSPKTAPPAGSPTASSDGICIDQARLGQTLTSASAPPRLAARARTRPIRLQLRTPRSDAHLRSDSAVDPASTAPRRSTAPRNLQSISHRVTLCLLIQPQQQTHPLLAGEKTTSRCCLHLRTPAIS